jgi:hypothetical protein
MVTGRVGQGAAFATPAAATRPAKAATIQCLNILFLFVDFPAGAFAPTARHSNCSPHGRRARVARRSREFTTFQSEKSD